MLKNNSYKQRFFYLLAGSIIFFLLCYRFAYHKTLSEYRALKISEEQLSSIEEAPLQLQILERKASEFERLFNSNSQINNAYQVLLLEKSTSLTKGINIKIVELPKTSTEINNGFITETQEIVFQGGFVDLLKLLHAFGEEKTISNICSVDFYSQKDMRSGFQTLKMKIFFQTISEDK